MPIQPKKLPQVDDLPQEKLRSVFQQAWDSTTNPDRHIALVTPGRIIAEMPCPVPGSMAPDTVQSVMRVVPANSPRRIVVIANTTLKHIMRGSQLDASTVNDAIPFFGYLLGLGYVGHQVVIFEGHHSAIPIACDGADVVLVDGAMRSLLAQDWQEAALKVMRGDQFIAFERKGGLETVLPLAVYPLTRDEQKVIDNVMQALSKGTASKAQEILDKAIKRNQDAANLWFNRAQLKRQTGQMEAAVLDLRQTLKLAPRSMAAWDALGNVYADLEQHDKAIQAVSNLLKLRPKFASGYYNRALSSIERGAMKEAFKDLNRAIQLDDGEYAPFYHRGVVLLKVNRPEKAIDDFTRALTFTPAPEFYVQRAKAYAMLGDTQRAFDDAQASLEGAERIWLPLAEYHVLMDEPEQARQLLKKLLAKRDSIPPSTLKDAQKLLDELP